MKKFLAANQYQRQHQEEMETEQIVKSSTTDSSLGASQIPSLVSYPDSPPDAMDLINVGHSSSSGDTIEASPSNTSDSILPVVATPTSNMNSSMPDVNQENTASFSLASENIESVGGMPVPIAPPKPLLGQQRNVVLERRVDVDENTSTNFSIRSPVICATKSVPVPLCDDLTKSNPQVPNIENINKQSVQNSISNNTSETEASIANLSSISNNKPLSGLGQNLQGAKNPYLMKKQSFIDNQFKPDRDLNKGDNSISSEYNLKVPANETPSTNTSLDSSATPMLPQSEMTVGESQQASLTNPVKSPIVPLEKEFDSLQQKRVSPISTPMMKSPAGSPLNSSNKQMSNKPKEELTKEEKEEQRRRRIHAFSEYQKKQKEALAKKDEERKLEQEKRRQEEIALSEQRKRLKSVRIPKRTKEGSPLVSPNPASPLIRPPEVHDQYSPQDTRNMYQGSVTRLNPQSPMTIVPPSQHPIPPPQQHQFVYNMTRPPQQQPLGPCVSSQQMTMNNTSIPLQSRQHQPQGMPINATVQQQRPGTGPVNIDLGKI